MGTALVVVAEGDPLPAFDEVDWRAELERLVVSHGRGHCTFDGKLVPGAYEAWERAWILLNRDPYGMIRQKL
jgi:hypothetical protein